MTMEQDQRVMFISDMHPILAESRLQQIVPIFLILPVVHFEICPFDLEVMMNLLCCLLIKDPQPHPLFFHIPPSMIQHEKDLVMGY